MILKDCERKIIDEERGKVESETTKSLNCNPKTTL